MAVLQLVSPAELIRQEAEANAARAAAEDQAAADSAVSSSLVAFIDNQFSIFTRHRDGASGWSDRLTNAMRVFNGDYDAQKLMEIKRFGGSEIYARLIATKCRGATSLLRDVYLNAGEAVGAGADAGPDAARRLMSAVMQPGPRGNPDHAEIGRSRRLPR